MKYAELLRELHSLKGKTLITFHSLGDVEAVASAIALSKLLHNSVVKSPDHTNSPSRHLLQALQLQKIPILNIGETAQYANVVLVDVANKEMLVEFGEELVKFRGKIIAIDHHEHGNLLKNAKIFEFLHRTSCCEVIYDLYRISNVKINSTIATLLLAGIVSDTDRFKTANRETFHAVSQLLIASQRKYEEILTLIKTIPDSSEAKSVLAALQNAELIQTANGLIGIAHAKAFEARTAAALVRLGCILAICVNEKQGKIAMLKDSEAVNNVNVGKLMKEAGKDLRGSGGGHPAIGGASGEVALVEKTLGNLVKKIKALLAE